MLGEQAERLLWLRVARDGPGSELLAVSEAFAVALSPKIRDKAAAERKSAEAADGKLVVTLDDQTEGKHGPVGIKWQALNRVVEWITHHRGVAPPKPDKPLRTKVMRDICADAWDANLLDSLDGNRQQLYDLIIAAQILEIDVLVHLGCAKVAALVKGQPLERIREILDPNPRAPNPFFLLPPAHEAPNPPPDDLAPNQPPASEDPHPENE